MAYTSTIPAGISIRSLLALPFVTIGKALVAIGEANDRSRKVQTLMALSDAELAERGLTRDNIVRHVFADAYYI